MIYFSRRVTSIICQRRPSFCHGLIRKGHTLEAILHFFTLDFAVLKTVGFLWGIGKSTSAFYWKFNCFFLIHDKNNLKSIIKKRYLTHSIESKINHLSDLTKYDDYRDYFMKNYVIEVSSTPIEVKDYFGLRKCMFNKDIDRGTVVMDTRSSCLIFYTKEVKKITMENIKFLLRSGFHVTDEQLAKFNTSTNPTECCKTLDDLRIKKKILFVNVTNGLITTAKPKFILLYKNGKKILTFMVNLDDETALFGPFIKSEEFINLQEEMISNRCYRFYGELVKKGHKFPDLVNDTILCLPPNIACAIIETGKIELKDFLILLTFVAQKYDTNFFLVDPEKAKQDAIGDNNKIIIEGSFTRPGPSKYVMYVKDDEIIQLTYLSGSQNIELRENGFSRNGKVDRILS